MQFKTLIVGFLAAGSAMAHMNMKDPTPLAYKGNPNTQSANVDYSITSPIKGDQYPCKGNLKFIGTPDGAPVATYSPGQSSTITIEGGAFHNGGSCQLSLSYDKGASFTVIKSFIGNCPTPSGGTFGFTIPADAPEGQDVVFAWTWVNKTGNREFYMSCAIVNIKAGAKRAIPVTDKRAVAFANRPQVFTANLGGNDQYCTKEGVDTVFPDPGPDVESNATNPGPALMCASGQNAPAGNVGGPGAGSNSAPASSRSSSSTTTSVPTQAPAVTPTTSVYVTSASLISPASSQTSSSSASSSSSRTVTTLITMVNKTSTAPTSTFNSDVLSVIPVTLTSMASSSTSNGGVFMSSGGTVSSTTIFSATHSAPVLSSSPGSPSTKVVTTQSTTALSSVPTAGAAGVLTGACSNEGAWNCIDGKSFQRCASGHWSAVISMAPGTTCQVGVSNVLSMGHRRNRFRRSDHGKVWAL